ncbi:hypothetical protein L1987_24280 [Smallanthus sonchifolius]|uniref:Uncharacterized protein n=1 Tax=Smallanthus sonchifolius TaxID=185202 RepID=A0ACB9ILF5_9ASTR|nr:hypothetical protein L1987_24280 [Smallanthus sonchifolius]
MIRFGRAESVIQELVNELLRFRNNTNLIYMVPLLLTPGAWLQSHGRGGSGWFTACYHSGMVQEAMMVFESMKTVHDIDPESQHLACMVELLGTMVYLKKSDGYYK